MAAVILARSSLCETLESGVGGASVFLKERVCSQRELFALSLDPNVKGDNGP